MSLKRCGIRTSFNFFRDIPFSVNCHGFNHRQQIIRALLRRGAGCSIKHELLGKVLTSLGLPLVYISYPFFWKDLPVDYPKELKNLADGLNVTYHLAIHLGPPSSHQLIDITWDQSLAVAGFPINYYQDQVTDGILAVKPCDQPIIHRSIAKRNSFISLCRWQMIDEEKKSIFYAKLNQWLRQIRKSP